MKKTILSLSIISLLILYFSPQGYAQSIPLCPEYCVIVYKDTGFRGGMVIDTRNYSPGEIHTLTEWGFKDNISSVVWNLPKGYYFNLHDHGDGTGRRYSMRGKGHDSDTHNNNFKDCATTFSFTISNHTNKYGAGDW